MPTTRSRRRAAAGLVGLVCALMAVGSACGQASTSEGGDTSGSTPTATAPPAATPPPELPEITDLTQAGGATFDIPDADWIQVIDGSAWATLGLDRAVRVSSDGRRTARVSTPAPACTAMDVGLGSLWIGACGEPGVVLQVDPTRGTVIGRTRIPGRMIEEEGSVAVGLGSVWVVTRAPDKRLVRIDPDRHRVVATYPLPPGVVGVQVGEGGLWVTDPLAGRLIRLDPDGGATIASVPTGAGARFFDIGEGAVWVQNNDAGTVSRVDPHNHGVVATITVDDGPVDGGDLAVGGGFVWARVSGSLVSKIDPRINKVVARYGPAAGSGSLAADASALWITAHDVNAVYRLPLS